MRCPFCHTQDTKVIDSRLACEGEQVRRRRECVQCFERFTSYEIIDLMLPRILKRDGLLESFSEEKLRKGVLKSLEKRSIRMEQIDSIISRLLNRLRGLGEREVSSSVLGDWVMQELRVLDEVAYVRFASVYRKFKDVNAFEEEIAQLKEEKEKNE